MSIRVSTLLHQLRTLICQWPNHSSGTTGRGTVGEVAAHVCIKFKTFYMCSRIVGVLLALLLSPKCIKSHLGHMDSEFLFNMDAHAWFTAVLLLDCSLRNSMPYCYNNVTLSLILAEINLWFSSLFFLLRFVIPWNWNVSVAFNSI